MKNLQNKIRRLGDLINMFKSLNLSLAHPNRNTNLDMLRKKIHHVINNINTCINNGIILEVTYDTYLGGEFHQRVKRRITDITEKDFKVYCQAVMVTNPHIKIDILEIQEITELTEILPL